MDVQPPRCPTKAAVDVLSVQADQVTEQACSRTTSTPTASTWSSW